MEVPDSADQWERKNQSATSRRARPQNQQHIIRQDSGDKNNRAGERTRSEVLMEHEYSKSYIFDP